MENRYFVKQISRTFLLCALSCTFWYLPGICSNNQAGSLCVVIGAVFLLLFAHALKGFCFCDFFDEKSEKPNTVCRILFVLYSAWAFLNAFLITNQYILSFKASAMRYTPKWFYILISAALVLYAVTRKNALQVIFRVSELVFPYLIFFVLLMLLLVLPYFKADNLKGFFENAISGAFNVSGISAFLSAGGIVFILPLFVRNTPDAKNSAKPIKSVLCFSAVTFLCVFLAAAVMGIGALGETEFFLLSLSRRVNIFGVLERPEGPAALCAALSSFIFALLLIYLSAFFICKAFAVEKNTLISVTAALSVLLLVCAVSLNTSDLRRLFDITVYVNLVFEYLIPLAAITVFSLKKGKRQC